jgi:hypothetical protein
MHGFYGMHDKTPCFTGQTNHERHLNFFQLRKCLKLLNIDIGDILKAIREE